MKEVMRAVEWRIRRAPTGAELDMFARRVSYSTEKAHAVLGYTPKFTMADGVKLSADWLRHHGYVASPRIAGRKPTL
jgi:nucleoside-diphosphate-sugar epimerase